MSKDSAKSSSSLLHSICNLHLRSALLPTPSARAGSTGYGSPAVHSSHRATPTFKR